MFGFSRKNTIIIFVAFVIVAFSLLYSNSLVKKLSEQSENRVQFYADVLEFISKSDPNCEVNFLLHNYVRLNNSIPCIVTDSEGNITSQVNIFENDSAEVDSNLLESKLKEMQDAKQFFEIDLGEGIKQRVYYDDPDHIKELRYYPYFQLFIILIFGGILLHSIRIAKKGEQNKIWVGLAKETAHQLGTPISSLMAWTELLKLELENSPQEKEYLEEIEKDIYRLEIIADRFSKIGSEPELEMVSAKKVLNDAIDYIKKRVPKSSNVQVILDNKIPRNLEVPINLHLFSWVIENLMKNSLDALPKENGILKLSSKVTGNQVAIDIQDNGKGMSKAIASKVFMPGFTTKKRGWGLGLSLSKRIITEYHKGKLYIKQTEPNKGTTFRIILNLA